jgi:lipocalin-like protein
MKRALLLLAAIGIGAAVFLSGWIAGRTAIGSVVRPESMTDVERAFANRMRGVTLIGVFTVDGRDNRTSQPDRYDIASVEKVGADLWRFNAKMECCGVNGHTLPVVVPMRFVGDTPMIVMTDTELPGIGTFTVRVFFYGDRYAGTWQHGKVGGQMHGTIASAQSASTAPRQSSAALKLVGGWQLTTRTVRSADGPTVNDPVLGDRPLGRLFYDASGTMALEMMRTGRTTAIGKSLADQGENPRVILGYDAYFGRYTVDERAGTITHHVEASLFPEDLGKDFVRSFALEDNTLTLQFTSPDADGAITRTLVFQRTEPAAHR